MGAQASGDVEPVRWHALTTDRDGAPQRVKGVRGNPPLAGTYADLCACCCSREKIHHCTVCKETRPAFLMAMAPAPNQGQVATKCVRCAWRSPFDRALAPEFKGRSTLVNIPAITRCNDCHGGREGSEAGVDAPTPGPGGRRRRFQEPAGGPIVPMAWLLLRNDKLVLYLCPELKDASFETLGAKVEELGLTLDFDIAAELARIDAKKLRRPARTAALAALRNKIHVVLGAGLKARQRAEREAAGSAAEVLAPSNRGRAHSGHRELRRCGCRARSLHARLCVAGTQLDHLGGDVRCL